MAGALRLVAFAAFVGAVVFAAAGRLDLPFVWGLLGVLVAFALVVPVIAGPDLMRERVAPGGANRDRLTRPLAALLLGGHWVLAGLDARFGWSPVPDGLRAAGLAGYAAALAVNLWALRANAFYSSAVRVQADRGQRVIDTGPYRLVRHPGYAATMAAAVAGGLALGSWVGAPAGPRVRGPVRPPDGVRGPAAGRRAARVRGVRAAGAVAAGAGGVLRAARGP